MMKNILWPLCGACLIALPLHAEDLESILSDSAEPVVAAAASAQAPKKETSALVMAIMEEIKRANSEQQVLMRHLENQKWSQALLQYSRAFEGTEYQTSASGRALLGYLQFMSGLHVTGMETLFQVSEPASINSELQHRWKAAVSTQQFVWNLAQIAWTPKWSVIFGAAPGIQLLTRDLQGQPDIAKLKELSEQAPLDSAARASIDWQLVLAYSLNDQADLAGKQLAALMKMSNPPVSQELMQLTAARLLYQNGYFDSAIKYYQKIPKVSEYWTEAQEEAAWAFVRKGEPQNAIAISRSLVQPTVLPQSGPEALFVHSLSQLKVCDYSGVANGLDLFAKSFKNRTSDLAKVASDANSPAISQALQLLKKNRVQRRDFGTTGKQLPRLIGKDDHLFQLVQAQKHFEAEAQAAETLYAQSLAETGLQATFEELKNSTLNRAQRAKAAATSRVQELAREEVNETKELLKKMHILEAEVIQQVSIAEKVAKAAPETPIKKGTTGEKSGDVLRFPADTENWFDEIGNYKVDVKKACHAKR